MTAQKLESFFKKQGYWIQVCTPYHVQIRHGGILFNVYPTKQTVYLKGATRGFDYEDFEDLKSLVDFKKQPSLGKEAKRKVYTRQLNKLWRKSQFCNICETLIEKREDASVDHVVPLSLGGSNRFDNLQLAHKECNAKRGNNLKNTKRFLRKQK